MPLILWWVGRVQICTELVSLTLARVACVGEGRLSCPPAVALRLPGPSIIPVALGAATSGAQSTQWVALLVGGRAGHSPILAEPQPRRIEAMRGQGRCPKGPGGRRAAAGRPPSLRTWPCPTRSDRQPATATWGDSSRALWGSCCCILRARWAAGTPHMPPRPGTAGMERQHATWAAALLGRLPRLPSTRLGQAGRLRTATRQPAMIKPSRFAKKKRASDMEKLQTHPVAIANRNPFVTGGPRRAA